MAILKCIIGKHIVRM